MLKEFREFAMKGNVVDLAVGVIIGAAFGAIVTSLVGDIIMPLIGAITGGLDFSNYFTGAVEDGDRDQSGRRQKAGRGAGWGNFLTLTLNFMIIAFVLFIVIRAMNQLKRKDEAARGAAEADPRGRIADRDPRSPQEGLIVAEKNERPIKVVAENRKARFNYAIEDTIEAGIALTGTEVKSIRNGKTTIAESYADSKDGEIWLINANIPEYLQANRFNHEPKRPRKLLLHRKQINKLMGAVDREGMTLIPLKLYFNERGRAKLLLAIAKGKKLHDKRESEKKRDWSREKGRLMRARG